MPSIFASVAGAARDLEALLLPPACLGCGETVDRGPWTLDGGSRWGGVLCARCVLELRPVSAPRCGRCGQTLDRWADGVRPRSPVTGHPSAGCGFCAHWPAALAWAASAVWLEGPARDLVHALKYGGWRVAAVPMAEALARHCGGPLQGAILVPVPLGRARQRARGYNQAAVLARELGRRLALPVACDLLMRRRETRSQTRLSPAERRANVQGAFEVGVRGAREAAAAWPGGVVLVDDVLTTGATLCEAAVTLAAAGVATAGAVTFGRAEIPR